MYNRDLAEEHGAISITV